MVFGREREQGGAEANNNMGSCQNAMEVSEMWGLSPCPARCLLPKTLKGFIEDNPFGSV